MYLNLSTIILLLAPLISAGGPEICTNNMDGGGGTDYQVTKDCCAHVHQDRHNNVAYFNEAAKVCMPNGGSGGNSVDTGRMVQCCTERGRGSHAV
jgi:hypothetical protein